MSQFVETACRTFTAGAALAEHRRVKLSSGKLAYAAATDVAIGTLERPSFADGDEVAVRLRIAQGTRKMVAAGAISAGSPVYAAANGKVAAAGSILEGLALEAAGADGDVIEVMPLVANGKGVVNHTANFALTAADNGSKHTTFGASGTVTCSLPPATVGLEFEFTVGAAQALRLDPDGSETIALPSTGAQQAGGKYISADAAGEGIKIHCVQAGQWDVSYYVGSWTAES